MKEPESVPSPCVLVCHLDDQKVCVGCQRTIAEIAAWSTMSDDQKREVLKRIGKPIE